MKYQADLTVKCLSISASNTLQRTHVVRRESDMAWIETIDYAQATGKLRALYDRIKGPNNNVDNIMMVHSLRPHTMEGHLVLYKNVLHHTANKLPKWYLEVIGLKVSLINGCSYCVDHHLAGLGKLIDDEKVFTAMKEGLWQNEYGDAFSAKEQAGLTYVGILTRNPAHISSFDINRLRLTGFSDAEILEVNQVASYFAYANRTVLGLGVNTDNDLLGLSPSSMDSNEWSHR